MAAQPGRAGVRECHRRPTDGTIKPINAKASTQDGLNPSCIVLDESHAQTFELHDVLKSSQGARANPLLLCPTTAGYDLLSSAMRCGRR